MPIDEPDERQRAAVALRESQDRLAGIVDSAMDAIITADTEQRVVLFNAAAEKMFGYSASEIIGRPLDTLIPPQFRAGHAGHIERFGAAGVTSRSMGALGALRGLRRNGEEFPIEASISHVEVGGKRLYTVILRDITERERSAAALRESQDRLSGIVNSAMDAIITVDSRQRVVLFNAAAEKMFGHKAVEMIGQSLDAVIPQRFRSGHARHIERFGAAGATSRSMGALGALSGLRRNGEEFPIEASISQVDVQGEKLYTVILRDITDRERSAAALHESQDRLSSILNSAMDAIITVDAEQRIIVFNAAAERMFRCPAGEAVGRSVECFVPARHRAGHAKHIQEFGTTGVTSRSMGQLGAISGVRADGEEFPLEASISQVEVAGEKLYTVILRDITDRKRAEAELHELNANLEQRVVERTAELEAFSYSVSHDLRAPLRTVDGFSQALLEDFGSLLPDEGRRLAQTIREGAQRMGGLIDDLLAFSRLGRQSLRLTAGVDMELLVREALEELAAERQGRHVEMLIGPLPAVDGDPALLRQVWTNLLSNALKYTRKRSPAFVEIGSDSENAETIYFVKDNGSGFDMRHAKKLFGVFQRLHRAEEFEGTGVGLAIVQRIVQRHGGRVWADAAIERGATMRFTIPGAPPL